MSAHRYWRVYITAGLSGSGANIAELDLRSSSGGANLSLGKTAAASSTAAGPYLPSNATDGNATSFWDSGGVLPCWLSVDLVTAANVVELAITVRPDAYTNAPKTFVVQSSDDNSTWVNEWYVLDVTIGQAETKVYTKPALTDTARHWGMWVNAAGGGSVSMAEIELRSSPGGSDFTGSGTATASKSAGGFGPDQLFDNFLYTAWDSASTIPAHWKYDLGVGVAQKLEEVVVTARDGTYHYLGPTNAAMIYSQDGLAWANLAGGSIGKASWTSSNEVATFSFSEAVVPSPSKHFNVTRYRTTILYNELGTEGGDILAAENNDILVEEF